MPDQRIIPVEFSIVATSNPTITIDGDNDIEIYIGQGIEFDVTFDRGGPPITEAQLRNSQLELFTDANRVNRLGAEDEDAYTHEFRDIDMEAGTAKLNMTVDSSVTARTLYANLVVEQGV